MQNQNLSLSSSLAGQYKADGFVVCQDPIIPTEVVRKASWGMDEIRAGRYETGHPPQPSPWQPGDSHEKLCKIEMPQIANSAIMNLITYPTIGQIAAEITGAEMVQVWWVQLLGKPPVSKREKTNIGWHQDRTYWQVWEEGSPLLTAWVAVSDVTEKDGPMRFVKGSHHWGFLENQGDFYGQDHQQQQSEIKQRQKSEWEEISVTIPAGGVSFHNCLTYHASGSNLSSNLRRSFAIHLRTEKAKPVDDRRIGLTQFIDNLDYCPIIYG